MCWTCSVERILPNPDVKIAADWISRVVAIYHEGFTVAQISEMFPEWGEPWMIAEIVEDFA